MEKLAIDGTVVLVGGGKMGGAMALGWLQAGLSPGQLVIVEPDAGRRDELAAGGIVHLAAAVGDVSLPAPPAVLVLAVKPQAMPAAAPACRPLLGPQSLVLSIAAGTPLAQLSDLVGDQPIVRVMPNTPVEIGKGAAVLCAGSGVDAGRRALAEALLAASSQTFWIEDEALMHAVTALSGSGPAYVFLLIEAMAAAGEGLGLPPGLAARLATATVAGAGELAAHSPLAAAALRRNVTSPNGTTQAALECLMGEPGLVELLARAMRAAASRSRELAGEPV